MEIRNILVRHKRQASANVELRRHSTNLLKLE
jgi:hypothetical protein